MTESTSEPMSPRERAAWLLVVQTILRKLATEAEAERRGDARQYFTRPKQSEVPAWDSVELGLVRLDHGASAWRVKDRRAFTAWVKETNPTAIVNPDVVVASWEKRLLDDLKHGNWVDRETGEVLPPPPGVEYQAGEPKLHVETTPEGERFVLDQLGDLAPRLGFTTRPEIEP